MGAVKNGRILMFGSSSIWRLLLKEVFYLFILLLSTLNSAIAADPFSTEELTANSPANSLRLKLSGELPIATSCIKQLPNHALTLSEVIVYALCNNPQTREAWANAQAQAAQLGIAKSAYFPTLDLAFSSSRNSNNGGASSATATNRSNYTQTTATLSLHYLLYDFGGREATVENAQLLLAALNATQDATIQRLFLAAVQAFYQLSSTRAFVIATRESEHSSLENLKAADAKYRIGNSTRADQLQAQTAAAQATLTRIRAEGNIKIAQGNLAHIMGLEAHQVFDIVDPQTPIVDLQFERNITELINIAKLQRPDLAAAEFQVKAAYANKTSIKAVGMPNISLFANRNEAHLSIADPAHSNAIGVALNVPLFTGFKSTYQIRAANEQLQVKAAQRDQLALQVALDVWQAYYALITQNQAIRAAADLLASAEQSAQVALGRYQAGVGNLLDLLNAQSALANAKQQHVQEIYNWRLARVSLAQVMGQLDFTTIDTNSK